MIFWNKLKIIDKNFQNNSLIKYKKWKLILRQNFKITITQAVKIL
jgi:hypothetical protein